MRDDAAAADAAPGIRAAFSWPVRVYWEDTDGAGIVYHAAYLRFLERARTEWLRALGFDQSRLRAEHDALFTVSRLEVDYLVPARLDDRLGITVDVAHRGRAGFGLEQSVLREPGETVARAAVRIACIGARDLRPRRIPEPVSEELVRES